MKNILIILLGLLSFGGFGQIKTNDVSNKARAFSKVGSTQATNNDAVLSTDDVFHLGKAAIGASVGSYQLTVNGAMQVGQNVNGDALIIPRGLFSTSPTYTFYGNDNTGITNPAAGEVGLRTQSTVDAIRIKDNGFVGIGTISPLYKLSVTGIINSNRTLYSSPSLEDGFRLKIEDYGGTANDAGIGIDALSGKMWFNNINGGGFYFNNGSGGQLISILGTGNVGFSTTNPTATLSVNGDANKASGGATWGVFSDPKLKKNMRRYDKGLTDLLQLNPITFQYNGSNGIKDTTIQTGFNAEEIRKILPRTVSKKVRFDITKDSVFIDSVAIVHLDKGRKVATKRAVKSLHYKETLELNKDELITLLVKSLQDEDAKVEKLTKSILTMKTQIDSLYRRKVITKISKL
jgi:hypothetical protein